MSHQKKELMWRVPNIAQLQGAQALKSLASRPHTWTFGPN